MSTTLTRDQAGAALAQHHAEIRDVHLRDLFSRDAERHERFSIEACGLLLDTSKHRTDETTRALLLQLAEACDVEAKRVAMFAGEAVNTTERRAALHTALRNRSKRPVCAEGRNVMPDVRAVLAQMRTFSDAVRGGTWTGHTGKPIRAVVNIGIGGSDLGPKMAAAALDAWRHPDLTGHFVSNLDARQLEETLALLDPETTLFLVASKTFGTQETLANARSARAWLLDALGDEAAVAKHFVALSTARERVVEFGIDPENMFVFWDWVGGRYSMWSAIGLSLAILLGMDVFEELLEGAFEMDEHFRTAPLAENLPVWMGLLGVWYVNFFGAATHAVLPYDYALRLLPAHLQQLEMESNGKRVAQDGRPLEGWTCPVVWGGPGNNGQHAFYQLLHQGTQLVPADVLVAVESQAGTCAHQKGVLANAFAQTEALMRGRTADEARFELEAAGLPVSEIERLVPHKVMPGNRPTSTILYRKLTPRVLGALVALYEHKVFVQSAIWEDNPFDQWGVELGKRLAGRILRELEDPAAQLAHDASTNALIERVR